MRMRIEKHLLILFPKDAVCRRSELCGFAF
jgi:hypothetical protein